MKKKLKKVPLQSAAEDILDEIIRQTIEAATERSHKKRTSKRKKSKKKHQPGTCVLSVSLGTGCYRHIRMPDSILLSDLAEVILKAFEFDNDHLHAFFMDNKVWSRYECYFQGKDDPSYPSTADYALYETHIEIGKKFKFLFDYGDEWVFQCKVLRLTEGVCDKIEIIRSKGKAPEQYWEPPFDY